MTYVEDFAVFPQLFWSVYVKKEDDSKQNKKTEDKDHLRVYLQFY